ncbi:nuclear pore complex-interacting protein family member A3-like isoform X5 [Pan paniscus]|uniref:nuclear pore complex-interacting protein family member A3-like isoform X5 n=1 Tax=Pan paniscus TaxID=9597 RepID=UPI0030059925
MPLGGDDTQVINTLADHRHRGTDFGGSPWLRIITVFLRSYKFAISLCTSYLSVSFLKTVFPSQNGHDGSTDVQQRARRSNHRRQEGIKIVLEAIFTLWRQVETKVRAKIHKMKVTTKVNRHDKINGKRKTAKEHLRKLSIKEREHAEKERQLSEAEENGKLDMKEIHTYKEMFQRAQALRRRAEDYHKCKIPPSARKPLCNWVRMAAAQHRHSSGLPYRPYLTAETLKNRMGRQPPPPTQPRCITHNSLSLKTPPECPLHPLPPSAPPSAPPSVDDNLKTPPECLITPLPPSADDNLKKLTKNK